MYDFGYLRIRDGITWYILLVFYRNSTLHTVHRRMMRVNNRGISTGQQPCPYPYRARAAPQRSAQTQTHNTCARTTPPPRPPCP